MFQTEIFYQKKRQKKSLPKILCREIRTKNLRRVIWVTLDRANFEDKFLPKNLSGWKFFQNIFENKSLPKNLFREIRR